MGKVLPFTPPTAPEPSPNGPHLRVWDLSGKRPFGHPVPMREKNGDAFLELGLVWVEIGTDTLWRITELHTFDDGRVSRVIIQSYGGNTCRITTEPALRMTMWVWDDHRKERGRIPKDMPRVLFDFLDLDHT